MLKQYVLDAVTDAYSFATAETSIEDVRTGYDKSMSLAGLPAGVTTEPAEVAGVPGAWFRPGGRPAKTILYIHGGSHLFGSSRSHGALAGHIAAASGAEVFVADYRLAPEHPHPAAVHDSLAVLRELIADRGADDVIIAGDSAGGGVVLATLLAARRDAVAMPAAAITLSAWADKTHTNASITARQDRDPLVKVDLLRSLAAAYLAGADVTDPLVSPARADLSGLPPLYLQVGSEEILYDDTMRVAEKVRAAGGQATVDVQEGMPHVHQILLGRLPEAEEAIERIGAFVRSLP